MIIFAVNLYMIELETIPVVDYEFIFMQCRLYHGQMTYISIYTCRVHVNLSSYGSLLLMGRSTK